jgi:hypothetical protein
LCEKLFGLKFVNIHRLRGLIFKLTKDYRCSSGVTFSPTGPV